ncbi:DNA ligase I [Reticulomyxa filosa]|uniref:DNA ligase I n=1 Tax=Reticulomyxa filosa TaxID=46433 RepID=X6N7P2_RETFI|nr:DNA ligase I [Reticulomyxa filosa]|eukprot:ETO21774.1 DNA ligase I [Reticulomyxa filosa]
MQKWTKRTNSHDGQDTANDKGSRDTDKNEPKQQDDSNNNDTSDDQNDNEMNEEKKVKTHQEINSSNDKEKYDKHKKRPFEVAPPYPTLSVYEQKRMALKTQTSGFDILFNVKKEKSSHVPDTIGALKIRNTYQSTTNGQISSFPQKRMPNSKKTTTTTTTMTTTMTATTMPAAMATTPSGYNWPLLHENNETRQEDEWTDVSVSKSFETYQWICVCMLQTLTRVIQHILEIHQYDCDIVFTAEFDDIVNDVISFAFERLNAEHKKELRDSVAELLGFVLLLLLLFFCCCYCC